jgi:hypothetical protein
VQVVPELWFPADTAPREVLARAATRFSPRIAFATGFGMEGCVLLHMIAARRLPMTRTLPSPYARARSPRTRCDELPRLRVLPARGDAVARARKAAGRLPPRASGSDRYAAERAEGETATAFFRRVELGHVKPLLADLENVTPANVRPEDFIDLEEEANFTIQTKEGECAA